MASVRTGASILLVFPVTPFSLRVSRKPAMLHKRKHGATAPLLLSCPPPRERFPLPNRDEHRVSVRVGAVSTPRHFNPSGHIHFGRRRIDGHIQEVHAQPGTIALPPKHSCEGEIGSQGRASGFLEYFGAGSEGQEDRGGKNDGVSWAVRVSCAVRDDEPQKGTPGGVAFLNLRGVRGNGGWELTVCCCSSCCFYCFGA